MNNLGNYGMSNPSVTPPTESKFFVDATNETEAALLHLATETAEVPLKMVAVVNPERKVIRFYSESNLHLNKVKNTFDHLKQLMKVNNDFKEHLKPLIESNRQSFIAMQAYNVN